jgi:hypothetical protein
MSQELEAVFDGKALQLQSPLDLAVGTRVRIIMENIVPDEPKQPKSFFQTAKSGKLQGDPEWSEKIDDYLYGETTPEPE